MTGPETPAQPRPAPAPGAAPQPRWIRRLASHCWRYRRTTLLTAAGSLLATGAVTAVPLLQRSIVDGVLGHQDKPVWPLAITLLAAAAGAFWGLYMRRYLG